MCTHWAKILQFTEPNKKSLSNTTYLFLNNDSNLL